jgi:hypothetical protein
VCGTLFSGFQCRDRVPRAACSVPVGRGARDCRLNSGVARAISHIGWSSRGGPGSTTTVGPAPSAGGTTNPGAVPTGLSTAAPRGITACLRFGVADRVLVEVGPAGQQRTEDLGNPLLQVWVEHHLTPAEPPGDLGGQVVGRRTEPTARDDEIETLVGHELQRGEHILGSVANDLYLGGVYADLPHPL